MTDIRLADSHAHLDLPEYQADQSQVIQRAWEAGVELIINIGISLDNSVQVLATTQKYNQLYCTVGVHPHGVGNLQEPIIDDLSRLAIQPKVVALGEIGLDFYRRYAPQEVQKYWFRRQLELAHALGKPVVIHTREATADTLAILQEYAPRLCGGVMHCFGGSYPEARAFLDLGLVLSLSGVLTYPKADPLREVVKKLPLEGLLIETDAPYLAPQPRRGKRNEPAYLLYTAQTLADLKGVELATVAQHTWNNTRRVFGLEATR
ncbi:MAG: TatD family hydrolase [Deltaproteobacteria bacterium]|nr:TatD family hydrolase [Deltaproteobacteria bacterium]